MGPAGEHPPPNAHRFSDAVFSRRLVKSGLPLSLSIASIRRSLLQWYRQNKRDLPWRQTKNPYRIWVSEIMLQQTRAVAVIPYYERFLDRFPTVDALAKAPEQDVLAMWAGLGYYSRARNLQKAAIAIHSRGAFPRRYEDLLALPGIGAYTAAAVASIAFGQPHPVLDGNVIRVLTRITAEPGTIESAKTKAKLQEVAEALLPRSEPGEFNQAVMELGATVCLPKDPQCLVCPVAEYCEARKIGRQSEFPIRAARKAFHEISRQILVIQRKSEILLWQRGTTSRRLAGFWELPEPEQIPNAVLRKRLGSFRHTIVQTHFVCEVWTADAPKATPELEWIAIGKLASLPLSTTARKALRLAGSG